MSNEAAVIAEKVAGVPLFLIYALAQLLFSPVTARY